MDVENKGTMPCRYPTSACAKRYGMKIRDRERFGHNKKMKFCGIASPDRECKKISREDMEKKNYKEIYDELKLMGEMLEELRD